MAMVEQRARRQLVIVTTTHIIFGDATATFLGGNNRSVSNPCIYVNKNVTSHSAARLRFVFIGDARNTSNGQDLMAYAVDLKHGMSISLDLSEQPTRRHWLALRRDASKVYGNGCTLLASNRLSLSVSEFTFESHLDLA